MKRESDLANEMGMTRKQIREIRQNALTVDSWTKVGREIHYSEKGEHQLRNEIQKRLSAESLGEPLPLVEDEEMVITQIPFNSKLVICGDKKVRVSSNEKFIKGMTIKARPPADGYRVWVLVGRTPRWRGRW